MAFRLSASECSSLSGSDLARSNKIGRRILGKNSKTFILVFGASHYNEKQNKRITTATTPNKNDIQSTKSRTSTSPMFKKKKKKN